MAPLSPSRRGRSPWTRLRWGAGAAKAYVEGPPWLRQVMRRQLLLSLLERHVTPLVAIDDDGITYLIDTADRGPITLRIFAGGTYEGPLMRRVVRLLADLRGEADPLAGRVFVDVGANIGTATLCALKRFGAATTLALEPHPANFRLLRMNLIANDVDELVLPLQVAVSDDEGELELEVSSHNIGDHRVRTGTETGPGAIREAERTTIRVPAITLDIAVERAQIDPAAIGLVWIDVQGHEPQVLLGADAVVGARVPILIEYWPYGLDRAGGLEALHRIVSERFTDAWNVGEEGSEAPITRLAASEVDSLATRYPSEDDSTNLLLLRG